MNASPTRLVAGDDAPSKAFLAATNRVGLAFNYDGLQLSDYRISCVGTALKLYNQDVYKRQVLLVKVATINVGEQAFPTSISFDLTIGRAPNKAEPARCV